MESGGTGKNVGGNPGNNPGKGAGGEVTALMHYEAQLEMQKMIHALETRLLTEIKPLVAVIEILKRDTEDIRDLRDDVEKLKSKSNWWDLGNSIGALGAIVTSIVNAALGK